MKKTLLAAALLTGGFAGSAMAQNSVTLYGRISLAAAYESIKVPGALANELGIGSGTKNNFDIASGYQPGASFWGIRGVEDLGGGLKAQFNFEGAVAADNGDFSGFNRRSFLALANDSWGRALVGRDFNAGSDMVSGIDPFGASWGIGPGQIAFGVFSVNQGEMIKYTTPSFSGFQASASYSFTGSTVRASQTGDAIANSSYGISNKNRAISAGVRYANGPVLLSAVYNQIIVANNAANTSPKNWLLGGTYDFKVAKLHAAYGQNIDGIVNGTTPRAAIGTNGDFGNIVSGAVAVPGARTNQWMIGASAPVGDAGRVLFAFTQQRPGGEFQNEFTSTQSVVGVGYTYSLSNRTSLFASYNYGNNLYMLEGVKINQVAVGVNHVF